jgi:rubrerythrin
MGRKLTDENRLSIVRPDIAAEWHPTKNGDLTPDMVSYGSEKRVWWKGKCGHIWDATINDRTSGNNCPYCAGKRVNTDNCLATKFPDIADEWHPIKNGEITPFGVTYGSERSVWWLGKCGHEWIAKISHRANGSGCPICYKEKRKKKSS